MNKVGMFETREQREIRSLRAEVDSLTQEVQSLSENLTQLMQQLYGTLEAAVERVGE